MTKTITIEGLKHNLANRKILLIDVRQKEEHEAAHIDNDHLIPLLELSLDKLPSTSLPIVFYCRSGVRSLTACEKILSEDPSLDVSSLQGGIMAWMDDGLPVKKL